MIDKQKNILDGSPKILLHGMNVNLAIVLIVFTLGVSLSYAWRSMSYFILTLFIVFYFTIRYFYFRSIIISKNYIFVIAKCTNIKKYKFDRTQNILSFETADNNTITIRINNNDIIEGYIYKLYFNKTEYILAGKDISNGYLGSYLGYELHDNKN